MNFHGNNNVLQHAIEHLQTIGNIHRYRICIFKDIAMGIREFSYTYVISVNNNLLEVVEESTNIGYFVNDICLSVYTHLLQYIENSFSNLSPDVRIQRLIQPVVSIQTINPQVGEWLKSKGFLQSHGIWVEGPTYQKRYFVENDSTDINLNIRLIK